LTFHFRHATLEKVNCTSLFENAKFYCSTQNGFCNSFHRRKVEKKLENANRDWFLKPGASTICITDVQFIANWQLLLVTFCTSFGYPF
jgi:hypothetical protein